MINAKIGNNVTREQPHYTTGFSKTQWRFSMLNYFMNDMTGEILNFKEMVVQAIEEYHWELSELPEHYSMLPMVLEVQA